MKTLTSETMTDDPTYVSRDASGGPAPIHYWFGLSYARYLTLPRVALQSMPEEWQQRFVRCLEELEAATAHLAETETGVRYTVNCRDQEGHFIASPWPNYDRGRAHMDVRPWREMPDGVPV